jgi:hypothetical protein
VSARSRAQRAHANELTFFFFGRGWSL